MSMLYMTEVFVPNDQAEMFSAFLYGHVAHGWEEADHAGQVLFRWHFEDEEASRRTEAALREEYPLLEARSRSVQAKDWVNEWKAFFTPVSAGRFLVLPPWLSERKTQASGQGKIPIIINPGTAFGTGHHATTALMLSILSHAADNGRITVEQSFLDLGTGSGILALALAKLGLTGTALDIDREAVANAEENIAADPSGSSINLDLGGLEKTAAGERFDVVAANILAGPLIEMAAELSSKVKPGGVLALSGILDKQAGDVAKAYRKEGLPEPERFSRGEWVGLYWA
jgi:ribosomal protein L11 methyltransferase